ncbi:hypothetical protein E2C01_062063 [Portunus trituberculatus]|uniref:Uncharacterized protein n=1 Tax=Portunus trituberculatus TaxID=210409 RepID=A0A5B7HF38_PORTR|nr:hypothetical protein [Portunus trituberculatus]
MMTDFPVSRCVGGRLDAGSNGKANETPTLHSRALRSHVGDGVAATAGSNAEVEWSNEAGKAKAVPRVAKAKARTFPSTSKAKPSPLPSIRTKSRRGR